MIVRERPNAFKLFFVLQGSVVPQIAPQILTIGSLALAVLFLHGRFPAWLPELTVVPFMLIGVALSIFLGFRNNAAYDRWWEARKQWGQLVVDARSLTRQAEAYLIKDPARAAETQKVRRRIVQLTAAFTHCLRHQLRNSNPEEDLLRLLGEADRERVLKARHKCDCLLRMIGEELGRAIERGLIGEIMAQKLEERVTSMAGVLAACERIHTTPLPFAYTLLLHRTAYLYCFLLPFGLADSLGYATPVVAAIVSYTFFGLDALSEELEGPFGTSQHDLALSAMSRTIEISIFDPLEEGSVPEPIVPQRYYLP